jgi:3-dehydrosphinganine reductase
MPILRSPAANAKAARPGAVFLYSMLRAMGGRSRRSRMAAALVVVVVLAVPAGTNPLTMKNFENKFILITGGSSGIGLALAKQFSSLGAHICILARRQELLEQAIDEISAVRKNEGQRFNLVSVDVSDYERVKQAIEDMIAAEGVPDVIVNSAGVVQPGLFHNLTPEDFAWNMNINYFGTVNVIHAVIKDMIARGSGAIVNISSMAGFFGTYGYTAYGASKYAVRGFSDALRSELKPLGITVHIVFPPDTATPQLDYDNANKPFVTKELSGTPKALSAEKVAASIISGISLPRYIITPGFDATLYYYLLHFTGNLVYHIMDLLISMAMRKERRSHHQRREQEGTHPDKV